MFRTLLSGLVVLLAAEACQACGPLRRVFHRQSAVNPVQFVPIYQTWTPPPATYSPPASMPMAAPGFLSGGVLNRVLGNCPGGVCPR